LVFALLAACPAVPVRAQTDGGPDPAKVRVRIGPLLMNPTIALTNIGIDRNVFNEPDEQHPKQDFTFTLTPATDIWLHAGRTWVTAKLLEDVTWYQKYASERTANNSYNVGWIVPLTRVSFKANWSYRNARERPGFEIDARSRRKEISYNGSGEIRALSKSFIGVTATRAQTAFDKDQVFLGANLRDELNRVSTTKGITLRHQLTPLTSVTVAATRVEDRFDFSALRDSNSTAVSASVAFDPFALIKGGATFGYRDFKPVAGDVPGFTGATAAVDLSYTWMGMMRVSANAVRDIQYSYDVNQPYYLLTGIGGSIAQQIFGPFDVVGRIGAQTLAYRDRVGRVVEVSNRTDNLRTYGVGVGYRMGKELRLGFNVDKTHRLSDVSRRRYNNLTFGSSVTYGS
jgi:hypothetical protein